MLKTTNPNSVSRLHLRRGLLLVPLVLACFAMTPAQAVTPPPVGGYPGFNTAIGDFALLNNDNTQGLFNTALGFNALRNNTTGDHNTAFGLNTLLFNTTGTGNMGIGGGCLRENTTGGNNTSIGFQAMSANTTGGENVAIGFHALNSNTTGIRHVAIGFEAMLENTTGSNASNALGYQALRQSNGNFNNAFGWRALASNTTGGNNVAMGDGTGQANTTGSNNTYIGANAGNTGGTGSGNIAIGSNAGVNMTTASNVICIGDDGDSSAFTATNRTFIGNIHGITPGSGNQLSVVIDEDGQLGAPVSSRRFKNDIKPMAQTSEAILKLKPVTFHYKNKDSKPTGLDYGLIAEDVAEVNPDWVVFERDGKTPLSVRYSEINVMLLNEFQKEHKKVQDLEKGIAALTAQLKEQASQIQKVSAQVELNARAPRTVANK